MTWQYSVDGLVSVLVLVFVIYRQRRWQLLERRRSLRTPVLIGALGIVLIAGAASRSCGWTPTAVALLLGEALLAFMVGMWMGAVSEFRNHEARWQVRTGAVGSLLWVLLIGARIGVGGVVAHRLGAEIIASGGAAVILIAINRFGRRFMIVRRATSLGGEPSGSAAH